MTPEHIVKLGADATAATTIVGSWLHLLPPFAALFAIIYYIVVLVEKATGKTLHQLFTSLYRRYTRKE